MTKRMTYRILAALMAVGLTVTAPGMTAYARTYGSQTNAKEIGPGVEMTETEETGTGEAENGESAGQAETIKQTEDSGQADSVVSIGVGYSTYMRNQGWSAETADNKPLQASADSWVTAMKAHLILPAGTKVGIRYQVNLSRSGWLDWAEDGAETGGAAGELPLEAIRMELYGERSSDYDLYYKVCQNGSWTDWALNGETAGTEGAGLRIDGIRAALTAKGAGAPEDASIIDPSKPMIALTFDDGPRTSVTSRILDSLQQNGGRATFFMVGSNVNANAGVLRRMAEQGCEVANHTYGHQYISKLGNDAIVSQVSSTNQLIASVCGVNPVVMRPPGGYIDARSLSVVGSLGMSAIMWSIDTRDWEHRNASKTVNTVLSQVKDGDIILMHDIYDATADAAVTLIPELTARGYQLVTVSELASYRGGLAAGGKYSQFR